MSEMTKVAIARAEVVALFEALGFTMAYKWDNKRLAKKCKSIGNIADDSVELPDIPEATLITIQEAVKNGQVIEVVDDAELVDPVTDDAPDDDDADDADAGDGPESEVGEEDPADKADRHAAEAEDDSEPAAEVVTEAPKRKRGRPVGSKAKPKSKAKDIAKPKVEKELKTEKKKKIAKQSHPKVLGRYSVGPFVRWLGRMGVGFDGAKLILDGEKCVLSNVSIKWELKERRENRLPSEVTDEDKADLQAKYPKVFEG